MPIVNNPTGQAAATSQAGAMIGKAEKAKADKAQMFQRAAEERAMNWELQKMEINSQQAFAHELRMNQAALEGEARAREWDIEKAEMASRIDFERKERDRQTKLAELDSVITAIDKSDLDEETKTFMKFKAKFESIGVNISPEDAGFVTPYMEEGQRIRQQEADARTAEVAFKTSPEANQYKAAMADIAQQRIDLQKRQFQNLTEQQQIQNDYQSQKLDIEEQRLNAQTESDRVNTLLSYANTMTKIENYSPKDIQQMGQDVATFEAKNHQVGDGTWKVKSILPGGFEKRTSIAEVNAYKILKNILQDVESRGTMSFANTIGAASNILSIGSGDPNSVSLRTPTFQPIIQENKNTGAKRISYDGRKTWQPYNQ